MSALLLVQVATFSSLGVANSHTQGLRPNAPVVFVPSSTQEEIKSKISDWDTRVMDLKREAVDTTVKDRFTHLQKVASKLDSKLEDVRSDFLNLRTAEAEDKQKHVKRINEKFSELTKIYNKSLAE